MGTVIILLPSFLLVTFLHVSGPLYGIIPPEERAALIALYKAANAKTKTESGKLFTEKILQRAWRFLFQRNHSTICADISQIAQPKIIK